MIERIKPYRRRLATALAYVIGRPTEDQAMDLIRAGQDVIGSWALITIDVDRVKEDALEKWRDHPELDRLVREACGQIRRKFENHTEVVSTNSEWAIRLISEFAKVDKVELVEINVEEPTYVYSNGDFVNAMAEPEGWGIFDCDGSEGGRWQICKIDTQDDEDFVQLQSDDEAWQIVTDKAIAGSAYHLAALRYIHEHNPKEWGAICTAHPAVLNLFEIQKAA